MAWLFGVCYNIGTMDRSTVEKINECIEHIKGGDLSYIETLHTLMGLHLRFIAMKYFGNDYSVDDIIQDFWLRIEIYCQKYHFAGNGFNYLARVFDNLCKEKYRKEHWQRCTISLDDVNAVADNLVVDEDIDVRRLDLRRSFDKAKAKMDKTERLVFDLYVYGELSIRQIAAAIGLSKSKVARLRQKALGILKQTLVADGWDNDEP